MTTGSDRHALKVVARHLGALRGEVTFVGGMIRALLVTDPAAQFSRPTDDIDIVAAVASQSDFYAFGEKLRASGFHEDTRHGAPLCRWILEGLTVDVMPDQPAILGFSNRWYPSAHATAQWHAIGDDPSDRIRVIDAPHFIATKLESFRGRGQGDHYHHDIEDVIAIVDGRAELLAEVLRAPHELRVFLAAELELLLADRGFEESLSGHLPGDRASRARLSMLKERLEAIARAERR